MVASWSLFEVDDQSNLSSSKSCPKLSTFLPSGQWFVMLELNPVCYHYTGGYRRDVRVHVASALAYVPPLIQDKNCASLHDIRTDLGERSNFSPLLLEAPFGRTLDRGRGASGSGAARPPKQCVWVSWAEQARALDEAVMKMVMISGRGDGGGKEFL